MPKETFTITNKHIKMGEFKTPLFKLPNSENISMNSIKITLSVNDAEMGLFSESKIEIQKNSMVGGDIIDFDNKGGIYSPDSTVNLTASNYGYSCLLDTNMVNLKTITFSIKITYNIS